MAICFRYVAPKQPHFTNPKQRAPQAVPQAPGQGMLPNSDGFFDPSIPGRALLPTAQQPADAQNTAAAAADQGDPGNMFAHLMTKYTAEDNTKAPHDLPPPPAPPRDLKPAQASGRAHIVNNNGLWIRDVFVAIITGSQHLRVP